jgi:hypothetical protein
MCSVSRSIGIAVLAILLATPASSEEDRRQRLNYSAWSKMLLGGELFFTGRTLSRGCKGIVAVSLIEKAGDAKKTLRVTLPTAVDRDRGAAIAIDQAQPNMRPFAHCFASGCIADYETGTEVVDQLKRGADLRISAFDQAGSPLAFSFPLAGFAEAYDGPTQEPKVYEYQTSSKVYQDMLKREEEERKARCGPD